MRKKNAIGKAEIRCAMEELLSFRRAQEGFLSRVRDEEEWYRLRVMPSPTQNSNGEVFAPTSAWLFNALMQKHADLMENLPTAVCLPREESDEADARALSDILPVILTRAGFEGAYSDNMWYKLKHGVCAWGVFWNPTLENGMGDIDVRRVELGSLFWQPGVRDLQDSRAVYYVQECDISALRARFPQYSGKACEGIDAFFLPNGENGERVMVVDWYYKKHLPNGRTCLHYCKFAGDTVLFSTENEPAYENGWYQHGRYPFVLDVLYPIEGSTLGFGVIAVGRDPQSYIDRMDRNLLEYMDWATRVRYFCKRSTGINEEEFLDLSRRIVSVEGDPDEERLRQIEISALDSVWLDLKKDKIKELKETTANRDVLQGSTDTGVTAAAAIAALQESGNKTMRDMIGASYRAFESVVYMIIECIRQFYGEARCFRILGREGEHRYFTWSNVNMKEQLLGYSASGMPLSRLPIFDIEVRAEKQDPYTRYSYNELLKTLYGMGVFHPENAAAAQILLGAMSFPGVRELRAELSRHADKSVGEAKNRTASVGVPATPSDPSEYAKKRARSVQERAKENATV
ncbi:MAG: hypothetical protein E7650_06295 [Ruminococcaceae bacterium]|nr:hypothetical protein [Oscillospiraceae bacterium]